MSEKLYVLTCISNPRQYESRYQLYREFEKYISQFPNVELYTVELAFGPRPHEVTDAANPRHVQVRSSHEFWHKENLLNIGLSRLPEDAKYIAWIDADVTFANPNWVQETISALHHHQVVQLFSDYVDLGPNHQIIARAPGFVAAYQGGERVVYSSYYNAGLKGATGLAWAARREALTNVGGLIDWCIIGSGDWHMAYCFIGRGADIMQDWLSPGYKMLLSKYQHDCDLHIKKNVGVVQGTAMHYWHGPKAKRGYGTRWELLKENNFDPILDLKRDPQGVYVLNPEKPELQYGLQRYFTSRDEDSSSLS